jgi:hypothetical protein
VGQVGRGGSGGAPAFFSLPPGHPGADGIANATYDYGDIEAFRPQRAGNPPWLEVNLFAV